MLDVGKVARKLRKLRVENGLTQDDVAGRIYVSRQAVSSWEMGDSLPSITSCITLLDLYDTTLEELLCLDERESVRNTVERILQGVAGIDIGDVMYQLSPSDRWKVVRAVTRRITAFSIDDVIPYCTREDREYLSGKGEDDDEL